ncbi:hypothetical protein [Streptomyces sp. NPDC101455]|uniref:hypothetical protein n=1 Tax=Streptomyces sp. NPDC101455 TaxID=3366142 RepID=UPI0037FF37EC
MATALLLLLPLACMHAQGTLLSRGNALLSVHGTRPQWRRRLATVCTYLIISTGLSVVLLVQESVAERLGTACGLARPQVQACGQTTAVLCAALLLLGVIRMARQSSGSAVAVASARRARAREGGTWWSVGDFAAAGDDPMSVGRLVREALGYADDHGIGLVAAARTPALRRAYLRRGFVEDPEHQPALIRPPQQLASASRESRLQVRGNETQRTGCARADNAAFQQFRSGVDRPV